MGLFSRKTKQPHILYNVNSVKPVLCERTNWKTCPEHKHLTPRKPKLSGTPVEIFNALNPVTVEQYLNVDVDMITPQWVKNEQHITETLQNVLPKNFVAENLGNADSTVSDVKITNLKTGKHFFIEAKSEKSQCGQFVLTENSEGKLEPTSGLENPYTSKLTDTLNRYRNDNPEDSKIDTSKLTTQEQQNVYSWVKHHYRQMGAEFIAVTDDENSYVNIVPIDQIENNVNISLNYPRVKQSGSAHISQKHKEHFSNTLKNSHISSYNYTQYEKEGKTFIEIKNNILSSSEQYVDSDNYFLSKVSQTSTSTLYVAKKRSATKNINEVLSFEYVGPKTSENLNLIKTYLKTTK